MDTGRASVLFLVVLGVLGGVILGATVMLTALEARDNGETNAERQVEELFAGLGGAAGELDILLGEIPAAIPGFAVSEGARAIGAFLTETDEIDQTLTYAVYHTDRAPKELVADVNERAISKGWREVSNSNSVFFAESPSVTLCSPPETAEAITVSASEREDGTSVLVIRFTGQLADAQCAPVRTARSSFGPAVYQRMLSTQPPAGSLTRGTESGGGIGNWQASTTFTSNASLATVVDHYQVALRRGGDLEFEAFEETTNGASIMRFDAADEEFGPVVGLLRVTEVSIGDESAYHVQLTTLSPPRLQ